MYREKKFKSLIFWGHKPTMPKDLGLVAPAGLPQFLGKVGNVRIFPKSAASLAQKKILMLLTFPDVLVAFRLGEVSFGVQRPIMGRGHVSLLKKTSNEYFVGAKTMLLLRENF